MYFLSVFIDITIRPAECIAARARWGGGYAGEYGRSRGVGFLESYNFNGGGGGVTVGGANVLRIRRGNRSVGKTKQERMGKVCRDYCCCLWTWENQTFLGENKIIYIYGCEYSKC